MNLLRSSRVGFSKSMKLVNKINNNKLASPVNVRYSAKMVRALNMVASSKLRHAQEQLIFARISKNNMIIPESGSIKLEQPPTVAACVFSSDRRLTGSLSSVFLEHTRNNLRPLLRNSVSQNQLSVVGSQGMKGLQHEFSDILSTVYEDVYTNNIVAFSQSLAISSSIISQTKGIRRFDFHYPHYLSATQFTPNTVSFAGFEDSLLCELNYGTMNGSLVQPRNAVGGRSALINFWEFKFAILFHHAHCEARAVETSSRLLTMKELTSRKSINTSLSRGEPQDNDTSFNENKSKHRSNLKPRSDSNKLADIVRRTDPLRNPASLSGSLRDLLFAITGKDVLPSAY